MSIPGLRLTNGASGRDITFDEFVAMLESANDVVELRKTAAALLTNLRQRCVEYDSLRSAYDSLLEWARRADAALDEVEQPAVPTVRVQLVQDQRKSRKVIQISDAAGTVLKTATIGPA